MSGRKTNGKRVEVARTNGYHGLKMVEYRIEGLDGRYFMLSDSWELYKLSDELFEKYKVPKALIEKVLELQRDISERDHAESDAGESM